MKKFNIYICVISFLFLISGCKKEGLTPYESGSGISIYKKGISEGRDSLLRSFAIKKDDVLTDTVVLPLRIVGSVKDYDRAVNYGIIPDSTTASSSNFELLPAVIPANSYVGVIKVKINKTADLKSKELKIWLHLLPSSDFEIGPKELSKYLIRINDYLSKPASWDNIRFGEYSQVKYGLIIRETGYFDFTGLHPEVLLYIVGKCRNALNAYIDEHGTEMVDENKVPVRFP